MLLLVTFNDFIKTKIHNIGSEHNEFNSTNTFKETRSAIDKVEKYIIDSGDQIGSKLDQQKISIYDWNDKIVKAVKQIDQLKKNKKQKGNKKEIKGTILGDYGNI